jgi:hypothetical protein
MNREDSFLQQSPFSRSLDQVGNPEICLITPELIAEISGSSINNISKLQVLDLHLRDEKRGKIRRIENLLLVPNLRQLNLSYNAISKIEGLGRLHNIIELNLAENAIKTIENLDSLRALERLNLSGNQIQRIPESISVLQRLTNFRIARNELDVVGDLRYLGNLPNLVKLRIDENPFSGQANTLLFAIYCVQSLQFLDGSSVTAADRQEARNRFATSDVAHLRSRLAEELHSLSKLKEEVGRSPERRLAQRGARGGGGVPGSVHFKESQRELDEAHFSLSQKLQQISAAEKQVERLQRHIEALVEASQTRAYDTRPFAPPQQSVSSLQPGGPSSASAKADRSHATGGVQETGRIRYDSPPAARLPQYQPRQDERLHAGGGGGGAGMGLGQSQGHGQGQGWGRYEEESPQHRQFAPAAHTHSAAAQPQPLPMYGAASPTATAAATSATNTPYRARSPPPSSSLSSSAAAAGGGGGGGGPHLAAMATQQITQLTERVEKLAAKLLASDQERTRAQEQLQAVLHQQQQQQQQQQQGLGRGQGQGQEYHAAASSSSPYSPRGRGGSSKDEESDVRGPLAQDQGNVGGEGLVAANRRLQEQLRDAQDALAAAVRRASEAEDKLEQNGAELKNAQLEAQKNALLKDSLRKELDTVQNENEKIRRVITFCFVSVHVKDKDAC